MKILLHMCCMPCSIYVVDKLRGDKNEVVGFSYNPNIHPKTEYIKRKDVVKEYSEKINLPVIFNEEYNMVNFIQNVVSDENSRCNYCYRVRLEETAKYAKENGFDAFTTTLLISPYQNHELIHNIGSYISNKYDIEFYYEDFRHGFREGQSKAKEEGLYRQKYCGCIYSIDSGKWE